MLSQTQKKMSASKINTSPVTVLTFTGRGVFRSVVGHCWLHWRSCHFSLHCSLSWVRRSWTCSSWGLCLPEGCRSSCTGDATVSRQMGRLLPWCRPSIWTAHPSESLWVLGWKALQFYLKQKKHGKKSHIQLMDKVQLLTWVKWKKSTTLNESPPVPQYCENVITSFHFTEMSSLCSGIWTDGCGFCGFSSSCKWWFLFKFLLHQNKGWTNQQEHFFLHLLLTASANSECTLYCKELSKDVVA